MLQASQEPAVYRNYACPVCKKSCNSQDQLRIHMSSRAHIRRCERSISESGDGQECRFYYAPTQVTPDPERSLQKCFNCLGEFTALGLLSHHCLASSQMDTMAEMDDGRSSVSSFNFASLKQQPPAFPLQFMQQTDGSSLSGLSVKGGPLRFDCCSCQITLNSKQQYESHLSGRKHQANLSKTSSSQKVKDRNSITAPTNGTICEVCQVPLSMVNMDTHIAGRMHTRNLMLGNSTKDLPIVNHTISMFSEESIASFYQIERTFTSYVSVFQNLKCSDGLTFPKFDSEVQVVSTTSLSNADTVVFTNRKDVMLIYGAQTLLGLLLANRRPGVVREGLNLPPPEFCFTVWLCARRQDVLPTVASLRQLLAGSHISIETPSSSTINKSEQLRVLSRPVLFVTLLKDKFTADDSDLPIMQHDIVCATAGSLRNFLCSVPAAKHSICGIVISGMECAIKNDALDSFVAHYTKSEETLNSRARIFCLCQQSLPESLSAYHFTSVTLKR